MAKAMCVILGLAFLAMGILGITGIVPMFTGDPFYVNIGEIVLGGLGLLVGVYTRQGSRYDRKTKPSPRQSKDDADRQRQENERLKLENEQGRKENIERQQHENEQLRKKLEQQKLDNEQMKKHVK